MSIAVITDSTSCVPRVLRDELGIGVAQIKVFLDGAQYVDDHEDSEEFFSALEASGAMSTTSQPSPADVAALMEERVAAGDEVVGVFISAGLSGTFESARLARDLVLKKHPEARIELVDSRSNSMEEGFAVLAAARAAAAGQPIEEVVEAAVAVTKRSRFLFVPSTLEYLRRGGRIGGAAAIAGTLLRLRPVLTAADGKTAVYAKVRGMDRALDRIVQALREDTDGHGGLGDVVVQHVHDAAAARAFAERITSVVGKPPDIIPIGPAVGAHVGPGALGIAYYTKDVLHD